jgi:hypothetical protein
VSLADHQRAALIAANGGPPALALEFDVWADGAVSMWTHFRHGDDYAKAKQHLIAIRDHLERFIQDGDMCPFHPRGNTETQEEEKEEEDR